jgi:anaerobic magnesium-protoporphyrin IX monomethyl ester cyclase
VPDVLLGQAYYLRFDRKLWDAQQPYAPLGALYAASHLREQGHSVALFDAMLAESEHDWAAALDREKPAVAVIYEDSFNYLSKMCLLRMRQAALTMIDAARARGCRVVVSGSDATDHPDIYLTRGAAAVILGEGELTLAEVVDRVKHAASFSDVAGIAFAENGAVARTQGRAFIKSLDGVPLPAWDLVDVERYRSIWRRRHGYYAMNVATTRGCPYSCNWCAKPIYGQRYAVRSPQAVVDELAWLAHQFHPDQISFVDDVFGLQPGWVEAFAELVAGRQLRLPFRCLMRADQINERVVAALSAAGCRMVWMGAESGSQRILDAMDKGLRVEQIHDAARLLHGRGIAVGMFLQFGYLSESWEDIEATLAMARDIDPEDIGVSVSYPLPGTKFYELVRAKLGPKQNWYDSNDLAMMYRGTYEPEFYRVLHRVVHHQFRVRRLARHWHSVRDLAAWGYNRAALPLAERRLRRLARSGSGRASTPARFAEPAHEPVIQRASGEGTA